MLRYVRQPYLRNMQQSNTDNDSLLSNIDISLSRFMKRKGLNCGASIAISKGGRLVYAKGLGMADKEKGDAMNPCHVMRVASVSKLLTAVAVMRLVEEGRLSLNQRVFGPTGILNDDKYLHFRDSRTGDITVRNLLNHTGGWNTAYGDPMFLPQTIAAQTGRDLPISIDDIIRYMNSSHLASPPGTAYSYSNYGYALLGEVVAKVANEPYESYVRSEIMAPIGVYDTYIGYSHKEDRLRNEVAYYEPDTAWKLPDYADASRMVRRSYGSSDIHTLGSAGGWVTNAVDLVKLMLTVDGFPSVADQLESASIGEMTDERAAFGPLGWRSLDNGTWYRTGTLTCTSAILARRPDGICYAVVLNGTNGDGPNLALALSAEMSEIVNHVRQWPERDMLEGDVRWQAWKKLGDRRKRVGR